MYWVPKRDGSERMRIADPVIGGGPRPHAQMPGALRRDYEEAQAIVQESPRGAGALLRLVAQKLVDGLVEGKAKLDSKIGDLVASGLSTTVAQALDALRVVGNNAVHPGEMVLDDDAEAVRALFECINVIVEDQIARPGRIDDLFSKLPQKAREAIQRRDGHVTPPGDDAA